MIVREHATPNYTAELPLIKINISIGWVGVKAKNPLDGAIDRFRAIVCSGGWRKHANFLTCSNIHVQFRVEENPEKAVVFV